MTPRTRTLIVVGMLALGAAGWWLARGAPVEVTTSPVVRGSFEEGIAETGRTRARWHVDLAAPVGGEWLPSPLKVGDSVAAGALLGSLAAAPPDPATARQASARAGAANAGLDAARAAVLSAEGAVAEAERTLSRSERLLPAGGVSEMRLDELRTAADLCRRELEAARARLSAAGFERDAARALLPGGAGAPVPLRAPAAGVVLRVDEEHARALPAGTPLLMLGALGAPEVVVSVLSSDAIRVRVGAPLRAACGADTLSGAVTRVEPSARTVRSALGVDEQRVQVIGDLPGCELGHDFEVDAWIQTRRLDGVLAVPAGALVRDGASWNVFVIGGDGRARRRPVTLLGRSPERAAIEGLVEGTRVVVYPPEGLVDGARVKEDRGA